MKTQAQTGFLFQTEDIRDTSLHTSSEISPAVGPLLFHAISTHDQAVTLKYQGTIDGTNWVELPAPDASFILAATTGRDVQSLTQQWKRIRCTAQCADAPTEGRLIVAYALAESN